MNESNKSTAPRDDDQQPQNSFCFVIGAPEIEVTIPEGDLPEDAGELKKILWEKHKDEIFRSMIIRSSREKSELEKAKQRLVLLDQISEVQRQFLQKEEVRCPRSCDRVESSGVFAQP